MRGMWAFSPQRLGGAWSGSKIIASIVHFWRMTRSLGIILSQTHCLPRICLCLFALNLYMGEIIQLRCVFFKSVSQPPTVVPLAHQQIMSETHVVHQIMKFRCSFPIYVLYTHVIPCTVVHPCAFSPVYIHSAIQVMNFLQRTSDVRCLW